MKPKYLIATVIIVFLLVTTLLWIFVGYQAGCTMIGLLIILAFTVYWIPKWLAECILKRYGILCSLKSMKNYKNSKFIAITIDDVPLTSETFRAILDLFKQYEMRMNCFVISDYINDSTKPLLIEAINDGHLLCNHGKTDSMHVLHSTEILTNEIKDCENKLNDIYQIQSGQDLPYKYYRPGAGFFDNKMLKLVRSMGYEMVLGNCYPNDPMCKIVWLNYLYMIWHISSGDLIILHDRPHTIPLLKRLLPWIKSKGYQCVLLNEIEQLSSSKGRINDLIPDLESQQES